MEPLYLELFVNKPEGTLVIQRAFFVPFLRNKYLDNIMNY
jgi:hypothetical protein